LLIHDAFEPNPGIQYMLANMQFPDYTVALGVIRSVTAPTYDNDVMEQITNIQKSAKIKCMDDLLLSGSTWKVE
jgi:2-oxoglutarate ferredoxin oxidoreductase subunit beta